MINSQRPDELGDDCYYQKPKDPRLTELIAKESIGSITNQEYAELYGIRAFPNSSVGQELATKELLGQATNEELAKLHALRSFPSNSRGQELVAKEYLGELTQEEAEELCEIRFGGKR